MIREIVFYQKQNGNCPVEEFLDCLDQKIRRKTEFVLNLIRDMQTVPAKFFKKLDSTDHIWEIRVEYEGNIYRIFGFLFEGRFVVLTNGFQKKSQKAPRNEIELAEKYKHDFLIREAKK